MTRHELQRRLAQGRAAAEGFEGELAAAYERVLAGVGRRAARRFRESATILTAAVNWAEPPDPESLVDAEAAARSARRRAKPVQARAVEAVVTPTTDALGISFEVAAPLLDRILAGLAARANTVAEGIGPAVGEVIRAAHAEGLSVPETAKLILARVNSLKASQALLLARSDLVAIANGGNLATVEAARSVGVDVETKTWFSAHDALVRPTHAAADGQTVPVDQPFAVGVGSLQYPGDPSGPLEETWNCRCTVIYGEGARTSAPSETISGMSPEALAAGRLDDALAGEKQVTRDLTAMPGRLEGLQHRLKSQESLARKIRADARAADISEAEAAQKINDALRYTKVFDAGDYAGDVRTVVSELQERGYSVVKWKDTWDGDMYKGINAVFRTPSGSAFELQFHTPESFALKARINHPLYEAWRASQDSRERYRLSSRMRRNARRINRPPESEGYLPSVEPALTQASGMFVADAGPETAELAMVAVYPRPEEAEQLAVEGGLEPGDLHVTLVFLGDAADVDETAATEAAGLVASELASLEGTVGGLGRFAEMENGVPVIVLPDVQGLTLLRERVVDELGHRGIRSPSEHGFLPHMTLTYVDGDELPDTSALGDALHFDAVSVVIGNRRTDFALEGARVAAASPPRTAAELVPAAPPPLRIEVVSPETRADAFVAALEDMIGRNRDLSQAMLLVISQLSERLLATDASQRSIGLRRAARPGRELPRV